jgi:hypothetical protein
MLGLVSWASRGVSVLLNGDPHAEAGGEPARSGCGLACQGGAFRGDRDEQGGHQRERGNDRERGGEPE